MSTASNQLKTERKDDIYFIRLNRPEKRNCLNFNLIRSIGKLLKELNQDENVNKIVIYGEGGNFCSGFDLNELKEENKNDLISLYSNQDWFKSDKLLISFVEGYSVGLGFELAYNCDILIANHTAKFGFLNRRFGLPTFLTLNKLKRSIGYSNALNLLDNAVLIDSNEAHNLGLTKYVLNHHSSNLNDNGFKKEISQNHKTDLTSDQIISLINSFEIDFVRVKDLKNSPIIAEKFDKFHNHLPDEWKNFDPAKYNPNSRHGKFNLTFWNEIDKLNKR